MSRNVSARADEPQPGEHERAGARPTAGRSPAASPAAATISGEGVSPPRAPPERIAAGSIAETTCGEDGRAARLLLEAAQDRSLHCVVEPGTSADGSVGRSARCLRIYSASVLPSNARLPVKSS